LSALGQVVTARDKLYFDDWAFLLNVEPRYFVLVSGYVEAACDAQTWGVALQLDHHTRGLQIGGLHLRPAVARYACPSNRITDEKQLKTRRERASGAG
jgi:hypothetical protein